MSQNSNWEQRVKTTAVEAEVPKTAALDTKSGAPYSEVLQIILLIESQETTHHVGKQQMTVPNSWISLRLTNCEWRIAQEGEGQSANVLTDVGRGQAGHEQSPGVTMLRSFNYLGFPNCLSMFLCPPPLHKTLTLQLLYLKTWPHIGKSFSFWSAQVTWCIFPDSWRRFQLVAFNYFLAGTQGVDPALFHAWQKGRNMSSAIVLENILCNKIHG